jgi:hypothetical protein
MQSVLQNDCIILLLRPSDLLSCRGKGLVNLGFGSSLPSLA